MKSPTQITASRNLGLLAIAVNCHSRLAFNLRLRPVTRLQLIPLQHGVHPRALLGLLRCIRLAAQHNDSWDAAQKKGNLRGREF
jgi:hypothetical protein